MLYLLPGLGADKRMYPGAWSDLPDHVMVEWPPYHGESTLAELAKRIVHTYSILDDSILIGSSLGGMVACEIAKIIPARRLILIGSAKSNREISRLLSLIHPLLDLAPLAFLQHAAGLIPTDLTQMFRQTDPDFMRAMCRAIFAWEGLKKNEIHPVRIHGRFDLIIPLPAEIQHILNGGHLLAMTHSKECVDIVRCKYLTD